MIHLIMIQYAYRISKKHATIGNNSTKQASFTGLFYTSNYWFTKERCTVVASLELIDQMSAKRNKGEIPRTTFLDLSEAFDTI